MICSICLYDLFVKNKTITASKCGHLFHSDCFVDAVKHKVTTCPLCSTRLMSRHAGPLHISKEDVPKSLGGSKSDIDLDEEIGESSTASQQGNTHGGTAIAAKLASVVKSFDFSSIVVPSGMQSTSTDDIDDLELDFQQIDETVVDNDKDVVEPSNGIVDASAIKSNNEPQMGKSENVPKKSELQHSNDSVTKGAIDQELVNANAVSTDKLSTSQVNATSAHRDKESDMVDDDAQVDSINESSANNDQSQNNYDGSKGAAGQNEKANAEISIGDLQSNNDSTSSRNQDGMNNEGSVVLTRQNNLVAAARRSTRTNSVNVMGKSQIGQPAHVPAHVPAARKGRVSSVAYDRMVRISRPEREKVQEESPRRSNRISVPVPRYNYGYVICCVCGKRFSGDIPVEYYDGAVCSTKCLNKGH